jgi:hypothetical protein
MWSRLVPRIHHELCWFPAGTGGQQALWGRDVRQMHKGPALSGP